MYRTNHSDTESELIEIKNVNKCTICIQSIEQKTFTEQIRLQSSSILVSVHKEPRLNPEPTIKLGDTQKPSNTQPNSQYLPKYRNVYRCKLCKIIRKKNVFVGGTGLDVDDFKDLQKKHRNVSDDDIIFRLIMVEIHCSVCNRYLNQNMMKKHMQSAHNWSYDTNPTQLYQCGCCDVRGILKGSFASHNFIMHDFPTHRYSFKVHAVKQKIVCEYCGTLYMEGREKKHKLKTCLQKANAFNTFYEETMENDE